MIISENKIIEDYLKKLSFKKKQALNFNDDVFYDSNKKMIFSKDTYVEGIHFIKNSRPEDFIKKIFRSSLSDIYCKGINPEVYFLSLSINKTNNNWLKNFTNQLKKESKKYGLFLGGGDTVKSKILSITISVIGYTKFKPILRSTAKKNDDIYITGNLGESFLGLQVLKNKINLRRNNSYFVKSFYEPNVPFKFSKYLHTFATASMDISDGLVKDLKNLCNASKCGAKINFFDLPYSSRVRSISNKKQIYLKNIFSRGDDYQFLFTANKKNRNLIKRIAKKTTTKVSRVGVITTKKNVNLLEGEGYIDLSSFKGGYIHNFS